MNEKNETHISISMTSKEIILIEAGYLRTALNYVDNSLKELKRLRKTRKDVWMLIEGLELSRSNLQLLYDDMVVRVWEFGNKS
ncbi:MAG: hypothetical protein KAW92_10515 [Candidatus Cloacimonetes bacterium]|nr:hypothetical protein [Candidatus Cloacimonadota bacterium]